jgi:hypothetical protein
VIDEFARRRIARQQMCFQAATIIRDKLGGSIGPIEERLEHIRVAALGSVAESRAVMHALVAKGLITEREREDFLDLGYQSLLAQITNGQGAKVFDGHG